jgi:hypothetical protein
MKIQEVITLVLSLYKSQSISHAYNIIDFDLNGYSSKYQFVVPVKQYTVNLPVDLNGYSSKYQFVDRPDCVYLAFKDYDNETILDIKSHANPSQNFATFKYNDQFFMFTWEPFITRFVVYIFENESEIKPFLLKNKNHLFEI